MRPRRLARQQPVTADPATPEAQLAKLRDRFELEWFVLVGDRVGIDEGVVPDVDGAGGRVPGAVGTLGGRAVRQQREGDGYDTLKWPHLGCQ